MLHASVLTFEHTEALPINVLSGKQAQLMNAGSPVSSNNSNLSANIPFTTSSLSILIVFSVMPFSSNDYSCLTTIR